MSRTGSRVSRARSFTLVAALFATLGVLSMLTARADAAPLSGSPNPLPGSTFEGGDGNQVASNPLSTTDWASPGVTPVTPAPDPNANDNVFAGGSEGKENDPGNWRFATQDGGSTPGKNNILDAYSHTPSGSTLVFLNLAFTRGNDTGTTYLAFELNQRAELWNNGKANIPCRTTGDIIVSYQVSGTSPDVILQKWTTATSDAATGCAKTGSLADYTAVVDNVNAQGAVNAAPITNFLPSSYPWPGNTIPAKLFGEASLNLTSLLGGALGTPCFSFGSIWMHTRASTSATSNLDDYIAPRPLLVRNCTASGTKFHDLDADGVKDVGEPGLAGFRMWADFDNDGVRDAGEPFDDTDADGAYTITNVQDPSGTYTIREQLSAGGGDGGWACSYPATSAAGGDFPCAHAGIDGRVTPNVTGKDFGNFKPGAVKVVKQTAPDGAAGSFGFISSIPGNAAFALGDGEAVTAAVTPGTYTATEAVHPDFDLTQIACSDGDSTGTNRTATFRVHSGETVTCVFTNTRKTGRLTVRKVLEPATDGGTFDLRIGDEVVVDDGGHLAQGTRTLPTGTAYTVSELAGAGTSLARYDAKVECRDGDTVVASGTGTELGGVPVLDGREVVCTFTNTRRPGTIEVVKDLVPADDGGTFDLKVGDDVVAAGVGDGGKGAKTVAPGTYTVSEAGAQLAKYDTGIVCRDGDTVVASGDGTSLAGVTVDSNQTIVCTITNTRRPGLIEVVKELAPAADEGRFDLKVGDDVVAAGVGDGGNGGKDVAPGDYTVSETGAGATQLAKYDAAIACTRNGQPAEQGDGASLAGVTVDSGDEVVCTITNQRRTGSLTVVKNLEPAGDGGTFDLKIGDDVVAAGVGDGGQGSRQVLPGTYDVSELGAGGTSLAKYDTSIACTRDGEPAKSGDGTSLAIAVDSGDEVVCTITNVRHGKVVVTKTEGGQTPAGTWKFRLTGGPDDVSITKDTATGGNPLTFGDLRPGAYTLCEIELPDGWHSSLGPVVDGAACVELALAPGETETLAVDNTQPSTMILKEGDRLVHHGDTITYTFDVSNTGNTPLRDVSVEDERCDAAPVRDAANDKGSDGDEWLEGGEVWRFVCTMVVGDHAAEEENPIVNVATARAFDKDGNEVTDTDEHKTTVIHPAIEVVKDGPAIAYAGDTVTYTFAAKNTGDAPLHGVQVVDDRCAPVTGPTEKRDGNADDVLDPGETWLFTCSKQVPAGHAIGDENPIRNVATASGKDDLGKTVDDTDDHVLRVLHPAIAIDKSGPATAPVGTPLDYTLTVTNPGDVPFAVQDVVVSDPRCEAPPAGPGTGADATPGTLDPGDTWTYTCRAQTTGQPAGTFLNTARVDAKDPNGRPASDTAEFPTVLTEQQQGVLPEEVISGNARLRGPSGCVDKPFRATVRGRRIARVTFFVDGRKHKRIEAKRGQRVFRATVRPGRAVGVHRVTARVVFRAASETKPRTLRLTFRRCRQQVITPQFTG